MRQAKKQSEKLGRTSRAKMLRLADVVRTVRIRLEEVKDKQSGKLDRQSDHSLDRAAIAGTSTRRFRSRFSSSLHS